MKNKNIDMNAVKSALIWIVDILQKHNIPFQIAGGLAVNAYGSNRQLNDIDIDIPEEAFDIIKEEVAPYIIFGPTRFKDELWDLFLLTLDYQGQRIDLSGAYTCKIYHKIENTWIKIITDFSQVKFMKIYDLNLPVIRKEDLIAYKKILSRPVDLIDIQQLQAGST